MQYYLFQKHIFRPLRHCDIIRTASMSIYSGECSSWTLFKPDPRFFPFQNQDQPTKKNSVYTLGPQRKQNFPLFFFHSYEVFVQLTMKRKEITKPLPRAPFIIDELAQSF